MMGCAQTSERFSSSNRIPIGRFYDNRGYPKIKTPPMIMVTGSPTPNYMKSALKKTDSDENGKNPRYPFLNRKPLGATRSVNFDEQVKVKARTPSPNKTWYEKESSTMPMKLYPNDYDDADDYSNDDGDIPSDSEQDYNDQMYADPHIPRLGTPTPLLRKIQQNNLWPKPNAVGNIYSTDNLAVTPGTRIKVRRRIPHITPQQVSPATSYDPAAQSLLTPTYHIPSQTLVTPGYRIRAKPLVTPVYHVITKPAIAPTHQISTQVPIAPTHQTAAQSSIISTYRTLTQAPNYQTPITTSIDSTNQIPGQTSGTSTYQAPVLVPATAAHQSTTQLSTETTQFNQPAPTTNGTPMEQKSVPNNGDFKRLLGFHPFKRPPLETLT